ncbi:MAG: SIR2 family protein, partial [Desulfomonilaceae bacterium]
MNRVSSIPDLSHLEQLRKRLWEGKEYGRAAVMVGAGFSRNAESKAGNSPSYPLWNELAGCLYEELYPPGTAPGEEYQRDKLRKTSGGGVLKLAQEYKTWFGRERLNKALLDIIPYRSYRPGILHRLLLSLPWSDVFTTNYDTLLEEALPSVYYRKYDVCLTMDEIPLKMKPRLVKLHGSFPSHTPFIITEEDYRRYPSRFAPFVNMVQQALMENALCLIGFSGDDPNFLNWTGWVRDNLKEHTPTIYLCGILNLSSSRRKVLQDRRIIPIDLSHLPLDQDMDSALKHVKALEWLLLSLLNGKPEDRRNWPVPSAPIIETPSDGLPPILPRPSTMSDLSKVIPQAPPDAEILQELLEAWKDQREQYPGWVVCPKQSRHILWVCTQYWLSPVAESMSLVKPWERLFLLRELNWRLERCLVPLGALAEKVKQIVISFNPFAGRLDLPDAEYHSDDIEWQHLDWEKMAHPVIAYLWLQSK